MSDYLGDYIKGRWSPGASMAQIAQAVAEQHGVTVALLKGDRQRRPESRARQEFMHRAYKTGRWSLPQIGRFLGNRDHTTVLWGIRAHERRAG